MFCKQMALGHPFGKGIGNANAKVRIRGDGIADPS